MPNFTSSLKEVMERGQNSYHAIGLDSYPIFRESYRVRLNEQIIGHYLNEEIGHETDSLFRQSMRSRMGLIMPYYNGLYKSAEIDFDPLVSMDYTSDMDGTQSSTTASRGETSQETNATSNSENRQYQYPQQQLRSNGEYMTQAAQSDSESDSNASGSETSDVESNADTTSKSRTRGRQQSAQSLIQEYRDTLLNIDQLVVDELSDLFMTIWTTGQAFTSTSGYYGSWRAF